MTTKIQNQAEAQERDGLDAHVDALVSDIPAWERRMRWLAGHEKTPRKISEDIIACLQEIDSLRQLVTSR